MNYEQVHCLPGEVKHLVVGNKTFKSIHDWELTEKDLEKARDELGETEERIKICLKELKEKLSKNKNCNYCIDDVYLLRFLRTRKYDVEKAYENIKLYYELRKKAPDLMNLPENLKYLLDIGYSTLLPYTDEDGMTYFNIKLSRWNPDELSYTEIFQICCTVCDIVSMNPKSQINGVIGIWDYKGMTRRHVTEIWKMGSLKTAISLMQKGYPYRVKRVIVVNANEIVRLFFRMFRPFLSKKIANRLILIGSDMRELHKLVNPEILLKSLGGSLEDEECSVTDLVMNNLKYLRYERSFS